MVERGLKLHAAFRRRRTAAILALIVMSTASFPSMAAVRENGDSITRREPFGTRQPNAGTETNRAQGVQISTSAWGMSVSVPAPRGFHAIKDDNPLASLWKKDGEAKAETLGRWMKGGERGLWWAVVSRFKDVKDKRVSLREFQGLCSELKKNLLAKAKKDGNEGWAASTGTVRIFPAHLDKMGCMGFTMIEKVLEGGETTYYVCSRGLTLIRFTLFNLDVTSVVRDDADVDKAVADTRARLKEWLDDVESANPGASFSFGTDSIGRSFALPNRAQNGDGAASRGHPYNGSSSRWDARKNKKDDKDGGNGLGMLMSALICGAVGGVAGLVSALFQIKKQ